MHHCRSVAVSFALVVGSGSLCSAQPCQQVVLLAQRVSESIPTTRQLVVLADPDGPGPGKELLVLANQDASTVGVSGFAAWDGDEWVPFLKHNASTPGINRMFSVGSELWAFGCPSSGSCSNGRLFRVVNGDWVEDKPPLGANPTGVVVQGSAVYAFGSLTGIYGTPVARLENNTWQPLGPGTGLTPPTTVNSAALYNGVIYASGNFVRPSDGATVRLARFEGGNWLETGLPDGAAASQLVTANGDLWGLDTGVIRRLHNGEWSSIPRRAAVSAKLFSDSRRPILYTTTPGTEWNTVEFFDNGEWTLMDLPARIGQGLGTKFADITDAVGFQGRTAVTTNGFPPWAGAFVSVGDAWNAIGNSFEFPIRALATVGDKVFAGTGYTNSSGAIPTDIRSTPRPFVEAWDGLRFRLVGTPFVSPPEIETAAFVQIQGFVDDAEFGPIAFGSFQRNRGEPTTGIARLSGGEWVPIGSPLESTRINTSNGQVIPPRVRAVTRFNGELFAFGAFTSSAGRTLPGIAVLRDGVWMPPEGGAFPPFAVRDIRIAAAHDGKLFIAGDMDPPAPGRLAGFAVYDGTSWFGASTGVVPDGLCRLTAFDGSLFTTAIVPGSSPVRYSVVRWDGAAWTPFGSLFTGPVYALQPYDGALHAGGETRLFAFRNGAWQRIGGSNVGAPIFAMTEYRGELLLGGAMVSLFADTAPSSTAGAYFVRVVKERRHYFAQQPQSRAGGCGEQIALTARVAQGYPSISYQWFRDSLPLADGPLNPASPDENVVLGVSGPTLTLSNASPAGGGRFWCVATSTCASVLSDEAIVRVSCCPSDFNSDSLVDDTDFELFATAYDIVLCADSTMPTGCPADLDADGFVDDADFSIFAAAFNAMLCP